MEELLRWGINLNSLLVLVVGFLIKRYIGGIEDVLKEIRDDAKAVNVQFTEHRLEDEKRFAHLEALMEAVKP